VPTKYEGRMVMEMMVQCKFKKGDCYQTAYVEKKEGLRVGAIVELKSEKEGDELGWEVISMGKPVDAEYVRERSRDYTRTREASDI
jgi:hypothetical protein